MSWGPQRIFDPRTKKLRLWSKTPVTVAAGPPIDLSEFAGAEVTSTNLQAIMNVIMNRLAAMLAEIRGEQPPAELLVEDGDR